MVHIELSKHVINLLRYDSSWKHMSSVATFNRGILFTYSDDSSRLSTDSVSKASYNHSMDIINEKYGTKSMFGRNKSYFYRWGSMKIAGEDSTCGTKKTSQCSRICPKFSIIDR